MKRNLKAMILTASLGAILLSSCGGKKQQTMPSATFKTMKVEKGNVTINQKYSATIRGCQDIDVYPQVGGTLQKLCVTEGQKVKKGQTLFIIDQVPYQAALNTAEAALKAAEAQLATAQLNYDSRKKLFDEKVVSDFDIQTANNSLLTAQAQVAQAKAQVVNARNSLSYTVVKSPSDGVVGTLPYRQGALVSSALPQPLTTVSDNNEMYVYFSMTEAQLLQMARTNGSLDSAIQAMPAIKLTLVDGTEYEELGRVESASGVVDRQTGTIQMRAVFQNPNKLLHSGSTGNVMIPVEFKDQIIIPTSATVQTQDKYRVFVVDANNIANEQIISVSELTNGEDVIVTDGLKEGVTIVAEGAGMVKNGQNVKPKNETPSF